MAAAPAGTTNRATGPGTDADTLAAIIVHILGAPRTAGTAPGAAAYRAFPLKGAVGRRLQDRGLTVTLRISEDLESFEATTEIEVTSPPGPGWVRCGSPTTATWTGTATTAPPVHGDVAALADVIAPILRAGPGTRLGGIPVAQPADGC